MNAYATHVVSYLLAQSWQVAILAMIVGLISFALRNRSAHIRYLLWLIVLAKCLVPPLLTVPVAILPGQPPAPFVGGFSLPEEPFAPETSTLVGGIKPPGPVPAMPSAHELVALVWMAGVAVFLLWLGGRAVRYTAWLRARRKPLPHGLRESIRKLSAGLKFRKRQRIWLVEDIRQPFVWGLLRGSVYLPADFMNLHGSDRQRSILAHELSHVVRFDAGVNLLQVLVQAAYWFHPLMWWANRKIRQEREKCCDEMAVAHLNTPPEHYTGALVDTLAAERRSAHPIPSLAIVGSVKDIEERITTMLKPGKTFRKRPSLVAATVASLIALVTIPTALVLTARGQAEPSTQTARQPTADTEKPEQPRYALRTFNSKLAFGVFVQKTSLSGRQTSISGMGYVGNTPSATPLQIPPCWCWSVTPRGPVEDWSALAREVSLNQIPGLNLMSCTDSDLKYLEDLKDLRALTLAMGPITDAGLEHLKGLTGLEELQLIATKVTDAGLVYIKDLTKLGVLNLTALKITDAGLTNLRNLTGLHSLLLSYTGITDAGLQHLTSLTGLDHLNLRNTQVTDAGLEYLNGLAGLRSLELGGTRITVGGLIHLKTFPELRNLDLAGSPITDADLAYLDGQTAPRRLVLSDTQITDAGMTHVRGWKGLESLDLSRTRVTDAGLASLDGLTRLRGLSLYDTAITDAGLQHLKSLAGLELLELPGTKITDGGLEHLRGCTQLVTLLLNRTQITDAGLEYLKGLRKLEDLYLSGTQVTDAGVQQLKQSLPNLTVMWDQPQPPAQNAAKPAADSEKPEQPRFAARTFNSRLDCEVWIQEKFPPEEKQIGHTPSATPLEIPACQLWGVRISARVKDWDLLVQELSKNHVPGLVLAATNDADLKQLAGLAELRLLNLETSKMTDGGLAHLKGMPQLEQLWLGRTPTTDAGLEHLKGMTGLQILLLESTPITDAGLKHLEGLTGLRALDLQGTQITDKGTESLKGMTGMRALRLIGTRISDAGLERLRGMTRLQFLFLRDTKITDAGMERINHLSDLQYLFLGGTGITDKGLESLKDMTGL